ncbi:HAD family hydrolase [Singulisphaera sp. GP187]|uniref:sulfotransferase-like domain-containing protein n=1 Tax=Singulisphaera sp. GP187 TaxID=1882752 RepID=UPI00210FF032|nr:HAD family hydrolase [Singulisphaera sp. GP187]
MWSGPRNISTALMRSWGNRPDTFVSDEPLYAHYLQQTGIDHPGAAEVIAGHEPDWNKVVAWLTGPIPDGKPVFFQKQMAHHLLPRIDRAWLGLVSNAFLIRDPREMLASLVKVLPHPTVQDTGLPQQVEIFEWVRRRGDTIPPVVDARDVLEDPRTTLAMLCDALGVPFLDAMLSWPAGRRSSDGVWAKYWYANVEKSTSFQRPTVSREPFPAQLEGLLQECVPYYETLYEHRLRRPGEAEER